MRLRCKVKDLFRSLNGGQVLSLEVVGHFDTEGLDDLLNKELTAEIKPYRQKRSLDANAYFWALCDKLAEKTGHPKSEIYRTAIRDIGGNSETVCVREKAAEKLCSAWAKNGLGWQTETFNSKLDGCTNVTLYYGSSVYDKAQMSRLIDNIVQDCKAVGIETLTPDQINRLKEEWH